MNRPLLRHMLHFYGWGFDLWLGRCWLVGAKEGMWRGAKWDRLYLSPDGTPSHPNTKFLWRRKRGKGSAA
jgi:hypothetical protein